jgi:lipooligosaccharide transport system permease protein
MATITVAPRITPPYLVGGRHANRVLERNLLVYRHSWLVIFSGFFEPLFYLLSVGLGIGSLVGDVSVNGEAIRYAAFVAPGLLASASMNGAVMESTMNVFFKLKHAKTYDAILATPLDVTDVTLGEIGFSLMRGALYGIGFLIIAASLGLVLSWWAVLALPAAVLVSFAFAAAGMAGTAFMRTWQDLELVTIVTLPLFLFSATFYPLSTYPEALQWVVRVTPLYQGVALLRSLTTGTPSGATRGHAIYLAVMGVLGVVVAARRLGRLLLP